MTHLAIPAEREWLTAAEAAAEKLPGLPAAKRQVNRIVSESSIKTRPRGGRGGAREFHWSDLPKAARDAYAKRHGAAAEIAAEAPQARAAERDLRADARRAIVKAAREFIAQRNLPIGKGLHIFCTAYGRRRVELEPWVFTMEPSAAPHAIRLWERKLRRGSLLDRRGRPSGSNLFERDERLRVYVTAQYASRALSAKTLQRMIAVDLQQEVALRTLQAFLAGLRDNHAPALKALSDPDRHRSHHKPAFGSRSEAVARINQRWELDATIADAMCLLPDGSRKRFALTGIIDVFTRRAMVLVSDQPRGLATMALFRRVIGAWGVPEIIKSDNGKEFTGRAVVRFCEDVGIEISYSRPFTPEEKPHIERFFGTINRGLFPLLPGFVGHNIAQRKAIEGKRSFAHRFGEEARLVIETELSPGALQARIDCWLAGHYEQSHHSGIALRPCDLALAHAGEVKRIGDERALDALLMDAPGASGIRIVGKKGIRIGGHCYIAGALGQFVGYPVHVRMDPHDEGRIVVYARDRGEFICVAEDPSVTGGDRMAIARAAQKNQREMIARLRRDTRKVHRLFPDRDLAARLLLPDAGDGFVLHEDAERGMEAATPRLKPHLAAIEALDAKPEQPIEPTAEQREAAALFFAERDAPPPAAASVQCDGYMRPHFGGDDLGFWQWADGCTASGAALDAQDADLVAQLAADESFQLLLHTSTRRSA